MLTPENRTEVLALLARVLEAGVDFKLGEEVFAGLRLRPEQLRDALVDDLPQQTLGAAAVVEEMVARLLPHAKNEAAPRFLGFGDTGANIAALAGGLMGLLTQQNMINQSFDSPAATFAEVSVLRWLRDLLGYRNPPLDQVNGVWQVGGIITAGGTGANAAAMLLAREHTAPDTMRTGVRDPEGHGLVVPAGIGHYSVKASAAWVGCGTHLIEVPTDHYRYNLPALRQALRHHRGRIMGVVAYAGDSRTHTVERLDAVADIARTEAPEAWLHADACWGLLCALTDRLRPKITGIAEYDSVTVDAHKVLDIPYAVAALLVRDPGVLRTITTHSDLIMREPFAFGQVTPFVGSRAWESLRVWGMMRAAGRSGLAALAESRLERTAAFTALVDAHARLLRLAEPDMTAVVFCYLPAGHDPTRPDVDRIGEINRRIHADLLAGGRWYLHQFALPDDTGVVARGAVLWPLRFIGGNARTTHQHLTELVDEVVRLGALHEHTTGLA
ncbi:pyridoxal phosphate-dependent decarboxylase family protein [Allostreptomyces psammosilenae]|uniref:L-2,4-diaminobutyrate decarboxylase n=1 Tax=Allostreptomyces psammosilenae TaxID=1892865 RepID=A0A852ZSH0_9ACTN|nr:pyridoxal-dependent decarboxylase [Allostreptomyces psammosilenae]NYI05343.1 L-2,4-diaminobutyrate decarboxylase [Allostreptomyces psammosilenae]